MSCLRPGDYPKTREPFPQWQSALPPFLFTKITAGNYEGGKAQGTLAEALVAQEESRTAVVGLGEKQQQSQLWQHTSVTPASGKLIAGGS